MGEPHTKTMWSQAQSASACREEKPTILSPKKRLRNATFKKY